MAIVLDLNRRQADLQIHENIKRLRREEYQADITDDGRVLQIHWARGKMTNVAVADLLEAYVQVRGLDR